MDIIKNLPVLIEGYPKLEGVFGKLVIDDEIETRIIISKIEDLLNSGISENCIVSLVKSGRFFGIIDDRTNCSSFRVYFAEFHGFVDNEYFSCCGNSMMLLSRNVLIVSAKPNLKKATTGEKERECYFIFCENCGVHEPIFSIPKNITFKRRETTSDRINLIELDAKVVNDLQERFQNKTALAFFSEQARAMIKAGVSENIILHFLLRRNWPCFEEEDGSSEEVIKVYCPSFLRGNAINAPIAKKFFKKSECCDVPVKVFAQYGLWCTERISNPIRPWFTPNIVQNYGVVTAGICGECGYVETHHLHPSYYHDLAYQMIDKPSVLRFPLVKRLARKLLPKNL